jgi:tRNA pseudouridine38-40 synthase
MSERAVRPPARWRALLEYDGTDFAGWQFQPGQRTVQLEVESALERLLGHPGRVTASGRTDAGVHALGQVISFVAKVSRSPRAVRDGLNALLPADVGCLDAAPVADDFDPRRDAIDKSYRYAWLDRPGRSPLRRHRAWQLRDTLDVPAMNAAAQALCGEHDFSAFRASGCSAAHPRRTVYEASVVRVGDEVHFDVRGNAFLRHMVRNLAGTLVEVGLRRRPVEWPGAVLASCDRREAGRTAPPWGLALRCVRYELS